jgi:hypothetical protein
MPRPGLYCGGEPAGGFSLHVWRDAPCRPHCRKECGCRGNSERHQILIMLPNSALSDEGAVAALLPDRLCSRTEEYCINARA